MSRILAITGTSTDVGKTVVTAALAATAAALGTDVAVCKPVQTGVSADEAGDLAEIVTRTGLTATMEFARYPDPLAPETAARHRGLPVIDPAALVRGVSEFADRHELTLVEGAGGVLVRLSTEHTLLDTAIAVGADILVVVPAGLGALNHAELTVAAIRAARLRPAGLVIGSWPENPDLAMTSNRTDLARLTGVPVVGVVPAGSGRLERARFTAAAPGWFDSEWCWRVLAPRTGVPDRSPSRPPDSLQSISRKPSEGVLQ